MGDLDLDRLERLLEEGSKRGEPEKALACVSDLIDAAYELIAAARERDRLREAIRIGGALLRLERAVLGVPGGIDPEAERLRALCLEAAGYLGRQHRDLTEAENDLYERLRAVGGGT